LLAALALAGCAQVPTRPSTHQGASKATAEHDRLFALARLNERKGNLKNAEQIYLSLQTKRSQDPAIAHRLGIVAARQGRLEEARQQFEKAAAMGGQSSELLTDLGYCYYLMDNLPAAEQNLQSALAQDPQNQRARNNLALAVGEQGRFEESLAHFKLVNSEAAAHANLAYVYSQVGELQLAKEEYNLALSMNKQLRPAAEALVQIASEEPVREQARQLAASRRRAQQTETAPLASAPALVATPVAPETVLHADAAQQKPSESPPAHSPVIAVSHVQPSAVDQSRVAQPAELREPVSAVPVTAGHTGSPGAQQVAVDAAPFIELPPTQPEAAESAAGQVHQSMPQSVSLTNYALDEGGTGSALPFGSGRFRAYRIRP
jgi:Flp pilus assembly protein TadD